MSDKPEADIFRTMTEHGPSLTCRPDAEVYVNEETHSFVPSSSVEKGQIELYGAQSGSGRLILEATLLDDEFSTQQDYAVRRSDITMMMDLADGDPKNWPMMSFSDLLDRQFGHDEPTGP